MGKGDKRTKRGKLFRGSNGKTTKLKERAAPAKTEAKPARPPKPPREQPAAAPVTLPPAESPTTQA